MEGGGDVVGADVEFLQFPPFYTLQPVEVTQARQLDLWGRIVLQHAASQRVAEIPVDPRLPLFRNDRIQRQCSPELIRRVFDVLEAQHRGRWVDPAARTLFAVAGASPAELARAVHRWACDTAHTDVVLTEWELREGPDTRGQPFHGLAQDALLAALRELERQGRAVLFTGNETAEWGVKIQP